MLNSTLIQACPECDSMNYSLVDTPIAQAWDCWNCKTNHWIDDSTRLEYMVHNGVSLKQAQLDLEMGKPIFIQGQSERENG